jgi:uncharacterized OsmC-like protein
MAETLENSPHPLAFLVRQAGTAPPPLSGGGDGASVIQVDARLLHHHQKDAIVTRGEGGSQWRIPSDEGAHLKGSDLAPFPLGFFNAGLLADLLQRIGEVAGERDVAIDAVELELSNHYWFTGSFALGTGSGHAEAPRIRIEVASDATVPEIQAVIGAAVRRSPALALLRQPLQSTFALHVNGRRRELPSQLRASQRTGVTDPFLAYAEAPKPLTSPAGRDLIERTDRSQQGNPVPAASATDGRFMINVMGRGRRERAEAEAAIESWLQLAGATHFAYRADVAGGDSAPSGLGLLAAGIAFCFMTQLSRYVEHQKLAVNAIRMVQFGRFEIAEGTGRAEGVDTHLFLNGQAPEEVQANLVRVAAHTCYLHATLTAALAPQIELHHNGQLLPLA